MRPLHDYLDCSWIEIICINGKEYQGFPLDINYHDESFSGENEIILENREWDGPQFFCIQQSNIKEVHIIR